MNKSSFRAWALNLTHTNGVLGACVIVFNSKSLLVNSDLYRLGLDLWSKSGLSKAVFTTTSSDENHRISFKESGEQQEIATGKRGTRWKKSIS